MSSHEQTLKSEPCSNSAIEAAARVAGVLVFAAVTYGGVFAGDQIGEQINQHDDTELAQYHERFLPGKQARFREANRNLELIRQDIGDSCAAKLDILTGQGSLRKRDEPVKLAWLLKSPEQPCGNDEVEVLDRLINYGAAQDAVTNTDPNSPKSYSKLEAELVSGAADDNKRGLSLALGIVGGIGGIIVGVVTFESIKEKISRTKSPKKII